MHGRRIDEDAKMGPLQTCVPRKKEKEIKKGKWGDFIELHNEIQTSV